MNQAELRRKLAELVAAWRDFVAAENSDCARVALMELAEFADWELGDIRRMGNEPS